MKTLGVVGARRQLVKTRGDIAGSERAAGIQDVLVYNGQHWEFAVPHES